MNINGIAIFLGLVFVAVVLLSQGLLLPTLGDSARSRRRLKARLREIDASQEVASASLLREKYLKDLSPLARQLERLPGAEQLQRLIEQAGHRMPAHRLMLASLGLAALGGLLGWTLTRMAVAAVAGTVLGFVLPTAKVLVDRRRRLNQFDEQLPDAIEMMSRALRAGHPFAGGLRLVADDMQEPVAGEFRQAFNDINYGNDVRRAMLGLLARVPSMTLMALVTAVLVQRETGGNLAEILDQIARVVRERFKFQRRVRTLSAEGRMSAWVLVLIPFGLFALLSVTTPDYLTVMTTSPLGRKIMMIGGGLGLAGILWIRRIIRIEV
jgi:tight adherence protein B